MANNAELTALNAYEVAIEALTYSVDGQAIIAFPDGVAWVPHDRIEHWLTRFDNTGPWCALIRFPPEQVELDEVPKSRAVFERMSFGFIVVVRGPDDPSGSWEDSIRAMIDLFNICRNSVDTVSATLESGGTISDGPDGSYVVWGAEIDVDDLPPEYIGTGIRFTVGHQINATRTY